MTLALSWGIQASHEMPHPICTVSFETPFTATFSGLFCTTKQAMNDIEIRLERNPLLPKWDILIRPA